MNCTPLDAPAYRWFVDLGTSRLSESAFQYLVRFVLAASARTGNKPNLEILLPHAGCRDFGSFLVLRTGTSQFCGLSRTMTSRHLFSKRPAWKAFPSTPGQHGSFFSLLRPEHWSSPMKKLIVAAAFISAAIFTSAVSLTSGAEKNIHSGNSRIEMQIEAATK